MAPPTPLPCCTAATLSGPPDPPPLLHRSHCWCNQFALLVEAVERHLGGAVASDVYVWLDLFGEHNRVMSHES